jgi:AcrR family transcriptional regulator
MTLLGLMSKRRYNPPYRGDSLNDMDATYFILRERLIKKCTESRMPTRKKKRANPPRRRTQAERSDKTRTIILDASASILRRKGFTGLRTLEVAAQAGVSQGAQFHHFPTKKDLVIATIERVNAQILDASLKSARNIDNKADVIESIIEDASAFFFSDYFFMELSVGLTGDDEPEIQNAVRKMTFETRAAVEDAWRKRLVRMKMPERIASEVLALTLSVVRGFAVRTLIDPDRSEIERLFRVWREMVNVYLSHHNISTDG